MTNWSGWYTLSAVLMVGATMMLTLSMGYRGNQESAAEFAESAGMLYTLFGGAALLTPMVKDAVRFIHLRTGRLGWLVVRDNKDGDGDAR